MLHDCVGTSAIEKLHFRAVAISDIPYTIIMTQRIHNNDIIICVEKLKIITVSVKVIFSFVHCVFCSFFGNEFHSKYKYRKTEREPVTITAQKR